MNILVLNCGSSSIKYQLLDLTNSTEPTLLAKGLVERIGLAEGRLVHKPEGKTPFELVEPIADHTVGINLILKALVNPEHGVLADLSEIAAAGHRVAHGGEFFNDSAIINDTVKEQITACIELAPLHNPPALKGIESIERLLPEIGQVAVFDTSFHSSMPMESFLYGIPYKYYEEKRIRRYGFHGTSHKFVAQKACEMTGLDFATSKVVTCHIGNGASATAIKDGKSVNTSMGFTPLDGLLMGTRCGEIDPGVLIYIMEKDGITAHELSDILNKESGFMGVSGISSDMRDIVAGDEQGNERATLTMRMTTNRLRRVIGAYFAELGGADLVVFAGGIGENEPFLRHDCLEGLEFLGIEIDNEVNNALKKGEDAVLSTANSKVKVVVACTDEELVIASDTFRLLYAE
ncbi:MAG: acetate kinase [Rikenellaceae bacterium]